MQISGPRRNALFDLAFPEKARIRDELLEDVAHGRQEPEAAEAEARRLGIGPLCPAVSAEIFDVDAEPWWTLQMTIAWIVWRSKLAVREHYSPFRAAYPVWTYQELKLPDPSGHGTIKQAGFVLKYRPPSTIFLIEIATMYPETGDDVPRVMSASEARVELWRQLSLGKISAAGITRGDRKIRTIAPYEWPYLEISNADETDALVVRDPSTAGAGHDCVRLSRQEILKIWKAPRPKVRDKIANLRLCIAHFVNLMEASPDRPTMTRKQAEKIAKQQYGLSRVAARRAWSEAIVKTNAVAWSHPGRRPNKRAEKIEPEK